MANLELFYYLCMYSYKSHKTHQLYQLLLNEVYLYLGNIWIKFYLS
jgi:hypothetical protein